MNKTLTVALILATLPAVRAADSTEIRLGLATGMAPEYPGSDRYRASVNKNRAPAFPFRPCCLAWKCLLPCKPPWCSPGRDW